jgi:nucleolar MIF4G domain-containing protein 1
MPPIVLEKPKSRKERRKEERLSKKARHRSHQTNNSVKKDQEQLAHASKSQLTSHSVTISPHIIGVNKRKLDKFDPHSSTNILPNKNKISSVISKEVRGNNNDPYSKLEPSIVAALRRDDEEIALLESKLMNKSSSKDKERLKREFAKQEGYGTDFGDFLDDLDTLVQHVVSVPKSTMNDYDQSNRKYKTLKVDDALSENEYDDQEDEYFDASSEMDDDDDSDLDDRIESDEDSEEIVPMKEPAIDDSDDDEYNGKNNDIEEVDERDSDDDGGGVDFDDVQSPATGKPSFENDPLDGESSEDSNDNSDEGQKEPDHDTSVMYQPSQGEDIYGNIIETSSDGAAIPKKYIPPHLRNASLNEPNDSNNKIHQDELSEEKQGKIRELKRVINSALNRLSEGTIISVVQTISQTYSSNPTADINDILWEHTKNSCIVGQSMVMTRLIPLFVAALVGIHIQKGDSAQLVEFLLEKVVTKFWKELQSIRSTMGANDTSLMHVDDEADDEILSDDSLIRKEISNLALIVCYLYNYGMVHCTLLYDIIRHLIEYCYEIDVEILLLLLNHCGRTLRSDDPNALKEIIVMVQQKSMTDSNRKISSRSQFLVDAMTDLKKNKRQKHDDTHSSQVLKFRKVLGHIKSNVITSSKSRTISDSSLRITLRDILDANTKGRWWKVGASWSGSNPNLLSGEIADGNNNAHDDNGQLGAGNDFVEEDNVLLQLAAKYRMNTDTRRTIFCIITGAADYEDCFEKLVRAGMLKNRNERDTVRVLMECCGTEMTFNKFYAHLAARICDYQPQCKFTFQLAYWDAFKQFDEFKPRKVANLAKLLYHLVAVHKSLKLNVIKAIDIAAPEELSETALIFVTIFLSSIMEHFDNPVETYRLFEKGIRHKKGSSNGIDDDDMYDGDGIQASLTVFLVQILKASPKYKKGSKFRTNVKAAIKACDTDQSL